MKQFFRFAAIAAALVSVFACNKVEAPQTNEADQLLTKAYDNTGIYMVCYVETNDVNPLNAGDYVLDDGSTFFDIVELFAANIHKDDAGNHFSLFQRQFARLEYFTKDELLEDVHHLRVRALSGQSFTAK